MYTDKKASICWEGETPFRENDKKKHDFETISIKA